MRGRTLLVSGLIYCYGVFYFVINVLLREALPTHLVVDRTIMIIMRRVFSGWSLSFPRHRKIFWMSKNSREATWMRSGLVANKPEWRWVKERNTQREMPTLINLDFDGVSGSLRYNRHIFPCSIAWKHLMLLTSFFINTHAVVTRENFFLMYR